jgi:hypothetical protein
MRYIFYNVRFSVVPINSFVKHYIIVLGYNNTGL